MPYILRVSSLCHCFDTVEIFSLKYETVVICSNKHLTKKVSCDNVEIQSHTGAIDSRKYFSNAINFPSRYKPIRLKYVSHFIGRYLNYFSYNTFSYLMMIYDKSFIQHNIALLTYIKNNTTQISLNTYSKHYFCKNRTQKV